jgi:hypothetical protein
VTAKSSIRHGVCFINPAPTRETFCVLPWEICRLSAGGSILVNVGFPPRSCAPLAVAQLSQRSRADAGWSFAGRPPFRTAYTGGVQMGAPV